MLVPAVTNF